MSEERPVERPEVDGASQKWPVGFILLVVAAALYLLLRGVQMAGWVVDWVRG